MKNFHVFWSKPTITGTSGHHLPNIGKFIMYNFELIHFICSALMCKKLQGNITLYTDDTFYNYLRERELDIFWDEINTDYYKEFELLKINPKNNWTSFKGWLFGKLETPFLFLDHDNMLYHPIDETLFNVDCRFGHYEQMDTDIYFPKEKMDVEFDYDKRWDWNLDIPNTCLLYFGDEDIKNKYSKLIVDFYKKNNTADTKLSDKQYLFADQRLLMMLLDSENKTYGSFSNKKYIPTKNNWELVDDGQDDFFDHTWGWKHTLKNDRGEWGLYMERHKELIVNEFSEYWNLLKWLFDYDNELK